MAAQLRELAAEFRRIRGRLERVAIVFFGAFVAFTVLPITWSGFSQPPTALGWVGDSFAVHATTWMEGFLLPGGEQILVLGPFDAFTVIMEVGFYLALGVTIPYGFVELLGYLREGLYPNERRLVRAISVLALFLFLAGALFSLFAVLPPLYNFAYQLQGPVHASGTVSLSGFVGTTFGFILGLGLAFEIPTLCVALSFFGLLSSGMLRRHWRYGVAACFVAAFIISPGVGGGIIEIFIATVLSLLYGGSYFLVRWVERRRAANNSLRPELSLVG